MSLETHESSQRPQTETRRRKRGDLRGTTGVAVRTPRVGGPRGDPRPRRGRGSGSPTDHGGDDGRPGLTVDGYVYNRQGSRSAPPAQGDGWARRTSRRSWNFSTELFTARVPPRPFGYRGDSTRRTVAVTVRHCGRGEVRDSRTSRRPLDRLGPCGPSSTRGSGGPRPPPRCPSI